MAIYNLAAGAYIGKDAFWDEYYKDSLYLYSGGPSYPFFNETYYMFGSYHYSTKGSLNPMRTYLRFNLSGITQTITSATLNFNIGSTNNNNAYVREVLSQRDPNTAELFDLFQATNGSLLGTLTGTGAKSLSVTNYVNNQKNGFCDFGITGDEQGSVDTWDYIYRNSQAPYLDITVEASAPKYYIQQKSNYYNRRRSA